MTRRFRTLLLTLAVTLALAGCSAPTNVGASQSASLAILEGSDFPALVRVRLTNTGDGDLTVAREGFTLADGRGDTYRVDVAAVDNFGADGIPQGHTLAAGQSVEGYLLFNVTKPDPQYPYRVRYDHGGVQAVSEPARGP